jgi:hypothetical protein
MAPLRAYEASNGFFHGNMTSYEVLELIQNALGEEFGEKYTDPSIIECLKKYSESRKAPHGSSWNASFGPYYGLKEEGTDWSRVCPKCAGTGRNSRHLGVTCKKCGGSGRRDQGK